MRIASTADHDRRGKLAELLSTNRCIQALEVHNPISAIIAPDARVSAPDACGGYVQFDAFWSSSLADSTLRGLPDIEVLDARRSLANIEDIYSVTTKPLIMDARVWARRALHRRAAGVSCPQ